MKFHNAGTEMETIGEPIGEYTIINRFTNYLPYICAWLLRRGEGEIDGLPRYYWCQGHYFEKYEDAVAYAIEHTRG